MSFSVVYTMIAEFFPTNIRSLAIGWTYAWNKLTGVIAPFGIGVILNLNEGLIISILLCAITSFMAAGVATMLPDTKNREIS